MGELMLMIARESMTLLKRNTPGLASKMTRKQDWEAFLEFLKVLFNLADRVAAFNSWSRKRVRSVTAISRNSAKPCPPP